MIPLPAGVRVWLATGHTDMRKGFPSLALQVQEILHRDPLGGHLFCFRGRRGNLLKVIWHDDNPRSARGLIGPPHHAIIPRPSPDGYIQPSLGNRRSRSVCFLFNFEHWRGDVRASALRLVNSSRAVLANPAGAVLPWSAKEIHISRHPDNLDFSSAVESMIRLNVSVASFLSLPRETRRLMSRRTMLAFSMLASCSV
ncbi:MULTISPECIES: IS66 family insertion sequence element accessory protein TnpB [unclassified Bradyrhizobium]|uniref:IS66 family insertion sequence element accessory protein TnpB n=1 Tax=unclassified Bradyrhizobium TaxID=2631580 RepID=UPI00188DBFA5|nr:MULTISPECIES: IS66 family insertion sequence element accessory protein TnpB [unclassified Bradyrhizobium]MDN4985331.1 IS66 family insertion sequence element accessory protein TnpB [Bradyrhizobium sp. WYCCWR 13022]QOZ51666.1 hypothetical protein XH90_09915 [Bradyrhizobium sp. CCBAU 53338]